LEHVVPEREQSSCWRRNLRIIWLAELVAMIGFTAVSPILPLYVGTLGVLSQREVRLYAGLVFFVSGAAMAVFSPIWGVLSDRYGRKLNVERAMFCGAVLMALTGLVQNVYQLLLLRVLQGALTGTVTAVTTFVACAVPRNRSGRALGMLQTAIYVGATVGPLLGGTVADTWGYRASFFVTGALLFLGGVIVFLSAEEPPEGSLCCPPSRGRESGGDRSIRGRVQRQLLPVFGSGALVGVLTIALSVRMAARLAGSTLPLFVQSIAASDGRVATITGLISAGTSACGALGSLSLGRLGDRHGYRRVLPIAVMLAFAFYLPQAFVGRPIWLLPLQAGAGMAVSGTYVAVRTSLARLAVRGEEGIVYGIDASATSVAGALAPMMGSALAAWLGLRVPLLAAAALFLFAALLAFRTGYHFDDEPAV